jgi:hypothetical protein
MTAALPISPWIDLPAEPPFVLPDDAPHVAMHDRLYGGDPRRRLQLDRMPEPSLGRWDAPVVVLCGHPPACDDDRTPREPTTELHEALRRAIAGPPDHHLALADPRTGARHAWWRRATRSLREQVGDPAVARGLLTVPFVPYAADQPGDELLLLRLPSQTFAFGLVRSALRRGALVVLASHRAAWFGAVPELASHEHLLRMNGSRGLRLTPNTVDGYERITARLRAAAGCGA